MARVTTRPQEEDEDYLEEETEAQTSQPAVSDRRRRRLRARGIEPVEEAAEEPTPGLTAAKGRPTPSRDGEVSAQGGNVVTRTVNTVREYIHDVRAELLKVAWPTREETMRLSQIVIAVTAVSAAFLGLVSFVFGSLTAAIAQADSSTLAGIATIVIILVVAVAWLIRDRIFPSYE